MNRSSTIIQNKFFCYISSLKHGNQIKSKILYFSANNDKYGHCISEKIQHSAIKIIKYLGMNFQVYHIHKINSFVTFPVSQIIFSNRLWCSLLLVQLAILFFYFRCINGFPCYKFKMEDLKSWAMHFILSLSIIVWVLPNIYISVPIMTNTAIAFLKRSNILLLK
jgi:hypothetical protein